MTFCRVFFLIFLFSSSAFSNENIPVKYIDLNFIVNNSVVGKKIKDLIIREKNKLEKDHSAIEKKLSNKKNEILTKKNVLSEEDFKKEVDKHQKKVNEYQLKRNQDFEKMTRKNVDLSKNFMVKIDKIVIEYARSNSIDLLLRRDALIVSNSKLDITKEILVEVDKNIKKVN
jgi:Skp family chaperone for outer membrane proteins